MRLIVIFLLVVASPLFGPLGIGMVAGAVILGCRAVQDVRIARTARDQMASQQSIIETARLIKG